MESSKLLLRPAEVAEMLGVGRSTVYELIARGQLPAVRIGRGVRVRAEEANRWAAEREHVEPRVVAADEREPQTT